MTKIELVKTPGCVECEKVKRIIESEIKPVFPSITVEEIDATTPKGQELVQKYSIMASPGVLINGELFAMGGINKEKLIEKLRSIS